MKLDLSEIAHNLGMHYTYEVDYQPDLGESGLQLREPVRGEISFTNAGQLVVARGDLRTSVELECSRCLGTFVRDIDVRVDEQFPAVVEQGELTAAQIAEMHSLQEALDVPDEIYQDFVLDLTELIRQDIIVDLPFASICSEECRGLCPHCGQNLNEAACDCPADEKQGPLAGLKQMLEKDSADDAEPGFGA